MSKMACLCGGIISDSIYPSPTEGWVLRQQDVESYYDGACHHIVAFFRAVQAGQRKKWIEEFFGLHYPSEINDEEIVHDILTAKEPEVELSICECAQCGRLLMQQRPLTNAYRSYAPDEGKYAGALKAAEKK